MNFGLIIIGDEILSGRRQDQHLAKAIELLGTRGLTVSYAHYVGDDPARITATLAQAFASGDVVFSFGGIGATPDDHTRQCAAKAWERPLCAHPQAQALILERMHDMARAQGTVFDPNQPDAQHRLDMGVFPYGAEIIPNPFNKIPGFRCVVSVEPAAPAAVHFLPGFPVMAWPMLEWVLDTHYSACFAPGSWQEHSVIVPGAIEAALTPLMLRIEREHPVKIFSLPSVDHPVHGRHIELGVKGAPQASRVAFEDLLASLRAQQLELGPVMVRSQ